MTKYRTFSGEEIEIVVEPYTGGSVLVGGISSNWYAGTATVYNMAGNLKDALTVTSPSHPARCKYCNRLQVRDIATCEGCGAPL